MVIWPSFSATDMRPSSLSIVFMEGIILVQREHYERLSRRRGTGGHLPKSKLSRGTKSAATRRVTRGAKVSRASRSNADPKTIAALPDDALLELVQRQTFRYFWEGAHPVSGL